MKEGRGGNRSKKESDGKRITNGRQGNGGGNEERRSIEHKDEGGGKRRQRGNKGRGRERMVEVEGKQKNK